MPNQNPEPKLGIGENKFQFWLLAFLTFLIGVTIATERVALPPLAKASFGITSLLYTVSFISAFGLVKSLGNLFAGKLSDRLGRKKLLIAGWVSGIAFPLLIIFATNWIWIIVANLFLGLNQALSWTMTVTSKIDLVGPKKRGIAVGINEASGYVGVAIGGYITGLIATDYGLRPAPYIFALVIILIGLLLSLWLVKETLPWAQAEVKQHISKDSTAQSHVPTLAKIFAYVTWKDPALFAASQAGFINKWADSLVIGFFPLFFLTHHQNLATVGLIDGIYAGVWGIGQIPSGALTDHIGRKWPIAIGQFVIAGSVAIIVTSQSLSLWLVAATTMGLGTALVYPNLISVVGDVSHPSWRGSSLGVYRLWRDAGYAVGPIVLGLIATFIGLSSAFWAVVITSAASGLIIALIMPETEAHHKKVDFLWQKRPDLLKN